MLPCEHNAKARFGFVWAVAEVITSAFREEFIMKAILVAYKYQFTTTATSKYHPNQQARIELLATMVQKRDIVSRRFAQQLATHEATSY